LAQSHWSIDRLRDAWLYVPLLCLFAVFSMIVAPGLANAEEQERSEVVEPRYGMGLGVALAYDPSDARDFATVTGFALYDYDAIWPHRAPESLRFKVEGSLGGTLRSPPEILASVGFLALYYLDGLSSRFVRPYIEGGVGLIYTEYKVKEQGTRLNFNPQAGVGIEFAGDHNLQPWMSVRLHHLSNAGLSSDNRGVNSLVINMGWFF